jgi:hypothetical protein
MKHPLNNLHGVVGAVLSITNFHCSYDSSSVRSYGCFSTDGSQLKRRSEFIARRTATSCQIVQSTVISATLEVVQEEGNLSVGSFESPMRVMTRIERS